MVFAVGPDFVDDDFGGGRVLADGGDELVDVGVVGFGAEAEVADLLDGDDVPVGGFERFDDRDGAFFAGFGVGEIVVSAAFFVAGLGFGEVAGVAFEGAAADAGAAEGEVFVAGFRDGGKEGGGVFGEAVADGEEFECVAFGGGEDEREENCDGEDEGASESGGSEGCHGDKVREREGREKKKARGAAGLFS